MKLRLFGFLLILLLVACGGGADDIDHESIAKSLEDAFNSRDLDSIMSLWAEDASFEFFTNPFDSGSDALYCEATNRDCWQDIIDLGGTWKFSNFIMKGNSQLCFTHEFIDNDLFGEGSGQASLRFDGNKISYYAMGCP